MRADSPEERFGIMNLAVFLGVREQKGSARAVVHLIWL